MSFILARSIAFRENRSHSPRTLPFVSSFLPLRLVTNLRFNRRMDVGISIAQSGAFSMMGMQALKGVQLWISQVQKKGGLRIGQQFEPVRLIARDDHSRTSVARENIRSLINKDEVDVLLGPYSSHLTKAAAETCNAHQRLLWNHGGASDEIHQPDSNWIVSTLSPASQYFRKLPQWIAMYDRNADQYLILSSSKGTFASQVTAGLRQSIGALAKLVRVDSNELPENAASFIQLLNETLPKVLVLIGTFEQETAFFRTRSLWPKSIRYVACVSAGVREFRNALGELADAVIGPSQWESAAGSVPLIGPTSDEFLRNFRIFFREMPDYVAAAAFAAALIIEECIRLARSLDETKLRDVAHTLMTETFYGRFHIDDSGQQIGHAMHLVRWHEGHKIVLT
jgi:branched-chain amino acid transport system substrate-binding protein